MKLVDRLSGNRTPTMKPGAIETLFSISSAPKGMRAMRRRPGVISRPLAL